MTTQGKGCVVAVLDGEPGRPRWRGTAEQRLEWPGVSPTGRKNSKGPGPAARQLSVPVCGGGKAGEVAQDLTLLESNLLRTTVLTTTVIRSLRGVFYIHLSPARATPSTEDDRPPGPLPSPDY